MASISLSHIFTFHISHGIAAAAVVAGILRGKTFGYKVRGKAKSGVIRWTASR